jgi:hypothetical protein
MTDKVRVPLILLIFLCTFSSFGQDDSIRNVNISYYEFELKLEYNDNHYFTGTLREYKSGSLVFSADSFYSAYVSHYYSDLNGDGKDELMLSLTEGASPYINNTMLVWDVTRSDKPVYQIQNAEFDSNSFGKPVLSMYTRMSPSLMGVGYNWFLEYRKNKLALYSPPGDKKRYIEPDEESVLHTMKEFVEKNDPCADSWYLNFFEYVMIQYKIAGEEKLGEKFFEKHYKCRDSGRFLKQIETSAEDAYSWLTDEKNYLYTE